MKRSGACSTPTSHDAEQVDPPRVVVVATLALAAGAYWFGPQHLFLDQRVDEAVPTASDRGRPSGQTDGEVGSSSVTAHASFVSRASTRSVVRTFASTFPRRPPPGPPEALDDAFIDLGGLKGNQGNQNYEIPSGVNVDDVESVSIWCRRFSVGFGVAPLTYAS